MSEKIIAASIENLFKGCKVISLDKAGFKQSFIKSVFLALISLNSGKYLPACLINQTGTEVTYLLLIQSLRTPIIKI